VRIVAFTMKHDNNELPPTLVEAVLNIDEQIRSFEDQIAVLQANRRKLLNNAALAIAEFQVGQRVLNTFNKRIYEIDEIKGEYVDYRALNITNVPARLYVNYYGRQVKANGSLSERTKQLFNIETVAEATR
jgi:hypothetical protein